MGGVACARKGELDTCYQIFLSMSVAWTHSDYFLTNGTTLYLRVEVRSMNHTEYDWLELWKVDDYLLSVCWTNGHFCMSMVFVNVFLLIMVIWFFVDSFYNKLTHAIFVPCGWYMWWSWTFIRGSRWTTIDYMEWDILLESPSRRGDVGIILGDGCVLLINSSVTSSIILFELRM